MSMQGKSYSGWTNRETWLANLWLENEYALYKSALARAKHAFRADGSAKLLGVKLIRMLDYVRTKNEALQGDLSRHDMKNKVDLQELGKHWLETAKDHIAHETA